MFYRLNSQRNQCSKFYISLPAKPTEAYIGHTIVAYTNPLMSNKRNQCSNPTFLFLLNQQNYTPHEVSATGGTNSQIKHSPPYVPRGVSLWGNKLMNNPSYPIRPRRGSADGGTNSLFKNSPPTSREGSAGGGTNW